MPLRWSTWMVMGFPLHSERPHSSQTLTSIPAASKYFLTVRRARGLRSSSGRGISSSGGQFASTNGLGPGRCGKSELLPAPSVGVSFIVKSLNRGPIEFSPPVAWRMPVRGNAKNSALNRLDPGGVGEAELLLTCHEAVALVEIRLHGYPIIARATSRLLCHPTKPRRPRCQPPGTLPRTRARERGNRVSRTPWPNRTSRNLPFRRSCVCRQWS